ncbi:asparaginase [Candidatus Peregrinibacteria bacterium]|nr:asparaginase [Candidatus Peregrinibacteria bacterium]
MRRPKICLLFCGGTIGMVKNAKTGAMQPASNVSEIIQIFPEIQKYMQLDFKMIVNIDSSDMSPQIWTKLATAIHQLYDKYDGFVVAHGTDTMAYTASALSYALQNLSKPIVFTGSLIPLNEIGSDGRNNLTYACLTATQDIAEICIVIGNRIIRANRAKKYHESIVAVFHSPNFPYLGELGRPIMLNEWRKKRRKRALKFAPKFDSNISVLKIFPGFDPYIIENVLRRNAHGLILESFGPGNVPIQDNSLIPNIEKAIKAGIPVIIANQMEKGVTNLTAYQGGYQALKAGAISSRDMTIEATVTKLMWALGHTRKIPEIAKIMDTDLAGEIADPNFGKANQTA